MKNPPGHRPVRIDEPIHRLHIRRCPTGLATPTKRKVGVRMRVAVKKNNRGLNRLRSVVERAIAQIKTWQVLHARFRRPLALHGRVFFAAGGNFE